MHSWYVKLVAVTIIIRMTLKHINASIALCHLGGRSLTLTWWIISNMMDEGNCSAQNASQRSKQRLKGSEMLVTKSKRFCKCHCPIHKDKCPLTPCIFGEKRWPGSDGYITEAEKKFLDSLNPRPTWWTKAWGKRWESTQTAVALCAVALCSVVFQRCLDLCL